MTLRKDYSAHTDKQVRDMGTQLYDFTSKGRYGDYFNRGNNIHFDNRFCVLELKSLGQKPHLQQVVLLMMMFQISEEMFRGDKFEKKLLFIDEVWAQLTAESVARFIEDGYRRFRKFNGSIVIITQSMLDIFNNPRVRLLRLTLLPNSTSARKVEPSIKLEALRLHR